LPCVANTLELPSHLSFEALAFRELSTDRPVGLDRGAIPWRSIDAYAARYGLVGDDFDRFVRIIRAMDAAYLDYFRKPENSPPSTP